MIGQWRLSPKISGCFLALAAMLLSPVVGEHLHAAAAPTLSQLIE